MELSPFLGLNFLKKARGSVQCSWMSSHRCCSPRNCCCGAGGQAGSQAQVSENLYAQLGKDVIHKFSTAFYNSVYSDPEDWFRDLFKGHPKEGAIQNQYEFLVQRFGGPAIYSGRKGPPMMRRRHAAFPCNEATAARWLHHMEKAFEEVPEIDSESRRHMAAFFTDFAQHLVEGQAESYGLGRHGTGASR